MWMPDWVLCTCMHIQKRLVHNSIFIWNNLWCSKLWTHIWFATYTSEKLNASFFPSQSAYSKSGMAFLTCWSNVTIDFDTSYIYFFFLPNVSTHLNFQISTNCTFFWVTIEMKLYSSLIQKDKLPTRMPKTRLGMLWNKQRCTFADGRNCRTDGFIKSRLKNDLFFVTNCWQDCGEYLGVRSIVHQSGIGVAQYLRLLLTSTSLSISSSPYLCCSSRSLSICLSTSSRRA